MSNKIKFLDRKSIPDSGALAIASQLAQASGERAELQSKVDVTKVEISQATRFIALYKSIGNDVLADQESKRRVELNKYLTNLFEPQLAEKITEHRHLIIKAVNYNATS